MSDLKPMTSEEFDDSIVSSVLHRQFRDRIALALKEREQALKLLSDFLDGMLGPLDAAAKFGPDFDSNEFLGVCCNRAAALLKGADDGSQAN